MAVSYWLFNFTTEVYSKDGEQVFTSTDKDGSAQVVVHYGGASLSNNLLLSSMTYILETLSEMFQYNEGEVKRYLTF